MRVKILTYDQIKGKGLAVDDKGGLIEFSYKQFENEKMIPPESYADFVEGVLYPAILTTWEKFKIWVKGAVYGNRRR